MYLTSSLSKKKKQHTTQQQMPEDKALFVRDIMVKNQKGRAKRHVREKEKKEIPG